MQVVTYVSPSGRKVSVCPPCEGLLRRAGIWPRDRHGTEIVDVSMGLHKGTCDVHSLGDRIRLARSRTAQTQATLAASVGTTQSLVSAWELGHRAPTIEGLAAIATALDVTTDWLLGR
jgi:ribosome-binding protein aMBF1 (putative translation factor)